MRTTALLSFITLVTSLPSLQAQSVDDLQIERRSAFTMAAARNPFWPIGWAKPEPVAPGVVAPTAPKEISDAFFKPERFVVTSISIGVLPLALINGKTYGEGDLIAVSDGVNVQVAAIRDGEVTLRYKDKTIVSVIQSARGGDSGGPGKRR